MNTTKTEVIKKYIESPSDFRSKEAVNILPEELIEFGKNYESRMQTIWENIVELLSDLKIFQQTEGMNYFDFPLMVSLEIKKEQDIINLTYGTDLQMDRASKFDGYKMPTANDFADMDGNADGNQSVYVGMAIDIIYYEFINNAKNVPIEELKYATTLHYLAIKYKQLEEEFEKEFKPMLEKELK